jgi:hypothetical protein
MWIRSPMTMPSLTFLDKINILIPSLNGIMYARPGTIELAFGGCLAVIA